MSLIWKYNTGDPFLYLAPYDSIPKGVTHIINVTSDMEEYIGVTTLRVPVEDHPDEDISLYFSRCFQFLDNVYDSGGVALVHCMAGISRSSTIVIAYLMYKFRMTLNRSIFHVNDCKRGIHPNEGFFSALSTLEMYLYGYNTIAYEEYDPFPDI